MSSCGTYFGRMHRDYIKYSLIILPNYSYNSVVNVKVRIHVWQHPRGSAGNSLLIIRVTN